MRLETEQLNRQQQQEQAEEISPVENNVVIV
jgi:hypothetical protein